MDDRIRLLEDGELMVVPWYATGSTWDGTRRYVWRESRGRGYCTRGTTVRPAADAKALADELTRANAPF